MRLGLGLGVNKGRKASGTFGESVIATLEAQAATDGYTAFSGDTKDASIVLVDSLNAAGIWDKLDIFYVFATNGDSDFAKYNWKDPSSFYATEEGAGALTFTPNEGFTGDGTNNLNTSFIPSVNASAATLNDTSFGYYSRTADINDLNRLGSSSINLLGKLSGNYYYRINASAPSGTATAANSQGMLHCFRDGASSDGVYRNGVEAVTSTTASFALAVGDFLFLRRPSSGFSTSQLSIGWYGASLVSEALDFYTAVQTYMTTLGKQV